MRRSRGVTFGLAVGALLASVLLSTTAVSPATATNVGGAYGWATINPSNGDGFQTWDNLCNSGGYCNIAQLADNPVNMIYFHNANVTTIRNVLSVAFTNGGGAEFQFFHNASTGGSGLLNAGDSGRKNCNWGGPFQCNSGSTYDVHYRLYPEVNQYTSGGRACLSARMGPWLGLLCD